MKPLLKKDKKQNGERTIILDNQRARERNRNKRTKFCRKNSSKRKRIFNSLTQNLKNMLLHTLTSNLKRRRKLNLKNPKSKKKMPRKDQLLQNQLRNHPLTKKRRVLQRLQAKQLLSLLKSQNKRKKKKVAKRKRKTTLRKKRNKNHKKKKCNLNQKLKRNQSKLKCSQRLSSKNNKRL